MAYMDSSILHSLIDADIDALLRKVSLIGDGETPALVSGLLLAARRLLGDSESLRDDSEESEESKESESASSAAPAASNGKGGSQPSRPRRNLRAEMAGPLPALGGSRAGRNGQGAPRPSRSRKVRPVVATTANPPAKSRVRRVSSDSLSSGEPALYDVIIAEPDRICAACNGYFGTHPIDHNMPQSSDGLMAVVLCDGTRCYTQAGDMD